MYNLLFISQKIREKTMRRPVKCLSIVIAILFYSIASVYSQQLYVGANYHPHDDKDPAEN